MLNWYYTKCAKKISPTPLHHQHQPEPLRQGRMDPCFHVLYTKFWPYIWMLQQKSRLIRQATFLQSSIVQFWWSGVNCILRVLFLADMSGTRCGLVLLEPICFRVRCVVCSDGILYTLVVTSGYLSYCCFSIISNQSVHSPLTSDINKAFLNCCSLHIFSFSDYIYIYIYIYINISERPFLCWNIFSTFTWFYMKSHNLK